MASGVRYTITTTLDIQGALLAQYGAYDASTNPNGAIIHYRSADSIIFSCLAISDKVIRFYSLYYGYCAYGSAWVSGDAVSDQILFGGTDYGNSPTVRDLVLTDNAFVASWCKSSDLAPGNDRLIVIGKLSNGKYVCIGAYQGGAQSNLKAFVTDGNIEGLPVTGLNQLMSSAGEIYKTKIYFASLLKVAQENLDGTLAYLLDVESAYYQSLHLTATDSYILTPSSLGIGGLTQGFKNSLLIEMAA